MTYLIVMIEKCSHENEYGEPERHPVNVVCSYFRYAQAKAAKHLKEAKGK